MTKHAQLFQWLYRQILSGHFLHGQRLPSENELARRHHVSRPTAARALHDLESLGLLIRKPGAGTFLTDAPCRVSAEEAFLPAIPKDGSVTLGLLLQGITGTEIFAPIRRQAMRSACSLLQTVIWEEDAQPLLTQADATRICRGLVARRVKGVLFAPVQVTAQWKSINRQIVDTLTKAGIPIVLLDRDVCEYSDRSDFDLVGIDNFQAGLTLAKHLLERGARRLCFLARSGFPSTADLRLAGCHEAVRLSRLPATVSHAVLEPDRRFDVQRMLQQHAPDAVICANDHAAAVLLRSLNKLRVAIPGQLRVAGFEDVSDATQLPVSLTTIRQPCADIAHAAVSVLLNRIAGNREPARQILLTHHLVVRDSTQ